jgi:hypothetical protein
MEPFGNGWHPATERIKFATELARFWLGAGSRGGNPDAALVREIDSDTNPSGRPALLDSAMPSHLTLTRKETS